MDGATKLKCSEFGQHWLIICNEVYCQATINIKAGSGGHGCIAFLREKFRPKGGPCGGDGEKGGDVVLRGNSNLNTLLDVSLNKHYRQLMVSMAKVRICMEKWGGCSYRAPYWNNCKRFKHETDYC